MTHPVPAAVQQQISRVRRRLFLQVLWQQTLWCVAGALVLSAVVLLLWPHLLGRIDDLTRWVVVGSLAGAGLIAGVVSAIVQAPSRLEAALVLDHEFGLRERVTTLLTLTQEQAQTPAGQALLADVQQHLSGLSVGEKFPLRLRWSTAALPGCAALLVLAAFLYNPDLRMVQGSQNSRDKLAAAEANEVEKSLNDLKKQLQGRNEENPKSEKLKELENELARLLEQPIDPTSQDQVRERAQALRNLEEKMKERAADLKSLLEKKDNLSKELARLALADPKQGKVDPKEGPAKDLAEALAKGDMKKVQQELEKLARQIADKKLDQKQLQQLQQQMAALQQQLQRLADRADRKEELKKLKEEGKLSEEELKRALEQLQEEAAELQELSDIARLLGECDACLKDGDFTKAAQRLAELAGELREIDLSEDELLRLEEDLQLLEGCRTGMCRGLRPNGRPGGPRPEGQEHETRHKDAKHKSPVDPTGKMRITGFTRGGTFSRIPAQQVPGAFRQTAQEAQEAIERQRIAPEQAELLKGYYQNLGGQGQ